MWLSLRCSVCTLLLLAVLVALSSPATATSPSPQTEGSCAADDAAPPASRTIKTIMITGATDGLGLATAKALAAAGHTLLLHGRSASKLRAAASAVSAAAPAGAATPDTFVADLSDLRAVDALATAVLARHARLDVLLNNAGVNHGSRQSAKAALMPSVDVHLRVNTLAPYRLARRLAGALGARARVVNVASAAQQAVRLDRLAGRGLGAPLGGFEAYAMTKLALIMWSRALAGEWAAAAMTEGGGGDAAGRVVVAVNPGSMLATKMVRRNQGVDGRDIMIGVNILVKAAVGEEFADGNGKYFDNDAGVFASPHKDALDDAKNAALVKAMESIIAKATNR